MLGNLLDNACKWARTRVVMESTTDDVESGFSRIVITVDDDGPGLPPEMRDRVLLRGVRADEKAAGSGLGLAIVRDLAEVYRGSISLADSRPFLPTLAFLMTLSPSAYAAIIPYSMPLWTIFTKWPAPAGPQCR